MFRIGGCIEIDGGNEDELFFEEPENLMTMRFFPDKEKLKKMMRGGLPLIFAVAWAPMVWMLLAALLGPVMGYLFSSWQAVVAILSVATLAVTLLLTVAFRRFGMKIFGVITE